MSKFSLYFILERNVFNVFKLLSRLLECLIGCLSYLVYFSSQALYFNLEKFDLGLLYTLCVSHYMFMLAFAFLEYNYYNSINVPLY